MQNTLQIECLFLAQAFETMWAYYSQSGGRVYAEECRDRALRFVASYETLAAADPRVLDAEALTIGGSNTDVLEIVRHIREWGEGKSAQPYDTLFMSKAMTFVFLTGLKSLLLGDLNISSYPTMTFSTTEIENSARFLRWKRHLPFAALKDDPDLVMKQASSTPTIAVVGDIRRSQDLMTYAQSPRDFSERMVHFVTRTRELIEKHGGVFDKFTGDGFIVYFNDSICRKSNTTHLECFLGFIKQELDFAQPLFQQWSSLIRKQPVTEIGLAIGADLGKIDFEDVHDHLVAVGDSIVWAARMASLATSNEVIVNNLLFSALKETTGICFQEREGKTKAGETFLARALMFSETA